MFIIDTHAHLYADEFKEDLSQTVAKAKAIGVEKILLPNVDKDSLQPVYYLVQKFPNLCYPMLGLHPTYVKEDFKSQLVEIKDFATKLTPIAIGEIGLDYYWDTTFEKEQKEVFESQLAWAISLQLPVAIHTRKAWNDTLEIIKPYANKGLKGVFHCFSGSKEQAKEVEKLGWHMGIGGVSTYKNAGLAEVIPHIPLELLVLETDCPYLTPVPHRGKRNEPSFLIHIIDKIAEVTGKSSSEIANITSQNAIQLFNLNK